MKILKYLIFSILVVTIANIAIHNDGEDGPPCDTNQRPDSACQDPESNCQCYCSICGGYRNKKPGTDWPFYDPSTRKCYCNKRDRR